MGVFGVIFFGRAKVVAKYRRGAWRGFALGVAIEERSFAALRMTAKGGWCGRNDRRQSRAHRHRENADAEAKRKSNAAKTEAHDTKPPPA
jgi:hypothetical protein